MSERRKTYRHRRLEAFERNWRGRNWNAFSLSVLGAMSQADWFKGRLFK